jgi:hypothetical protein
MIWSDFDQLIGAILLIIGALLPVVNPLGDAPIFLRMTPGCDEPTRAMLAKRIAFYSFFMVLGSLLLGSFVLLMFGLSIPVGKWRAEPWFARWVGSSWPTFPNLPMRPWMRSMPRLSRSGAPSLR